MAQIVQASTEGIEKPTPEQNYELTLGSTLAVSMSRNEVIGRVLKVAVSSCQTLTINAPTGVTVSLFHMPQVTTTTASFKGGIVGNHYDPLVPLYTTSNQVCATDTFIWADIAVASTVAPGTYTFNIQDLPVTLTVWNLTMPVKPTLSFYMDVEPASLLSAHGLSADSTVTQESPLVMSYINALRANRIEPIEQMIATPAINSNGVGMNLDNFSTMGGSFRETEMTGSIAPVCDIAPSDIGDTWASAATLAAWEASFKIEPLLANSWVYLTDEPTDLTDTATRAQLVRTNAPDLKTMITHEPATNLIGLIDHFTVIFEYFMAAGHWSDYSQAPGYWMYGSCVSHGSCSNGTVGTLTGTPDLMQDEPDVNPRAFPMVAYALGAQAALYYDSDQAYGQLNPWTSQYLFGGNGDGTLFYPGVLGQMGFTDNEAVNSIRLKAIRQGQYDIEYLNLAKQAGLATSLSTVVPNQYTWSRNNADYDAMRQAIGNSLGQ